MLGMAIESFTPGGDLNVPDEAGELVCMKPFPCMPAGFWPLSGFGSDESVKAAEERYRQAYFSEFEGYWCMSYFYSGHLIFFMIKLFVSEDHGDHIVITRSKSGNGGGVIMLGRSDGVLYVARSFKPMIWSYDLFRRNPGGIRFGSSELYDVIDLCFSSTTADLAVVDCLAVGQSIDRGSDERVILFVKLPEGQMLSAALERKIRTEVRVRRSPRHVPARVSCTYVRLSESPEVILTPCAEF